MGEGPENCVKLSIRVDNLIKRVQPLLVAFLYLYIAVSFFVVGNLWVGLRNECLAREKFRAAALIVIEKDPDTEATDLALIEGQIPTERC